VSQGIDSGDSGPRRRRAKPAAVLVGVLIGLALFALTAVVYPLEHTHLHLPVVAWVLTSVGDPILVLAILAATGLLFESDPTAPPRLGQATGRIATPAQPHLWTASPTPNGWRWRGAINAPHWLGWSHAPNPTAALDIDAQHLSIHVTLAWLFLLRPLELAAADQPQRYPVRTRFGRKGGSHPACRGPTLVLLDRSRLGDPLNPGMGRIPGLSGRTKAEVAVRAGCQRSRTPPRPVLSFAPINAESAWCAPPTARLAPGSRRRLSLRAGDPGDSIPRGRFPTGRKSRRACRWPLETGQMAASRSVRQTTTIVAVPTDLRAMHQEPGGSGKTPIIFLIAWVLFCQGGKRTAPNAVLMAARMSPHSGPVAPEKVPK